MKKFIGGSIGIIIGLIGLSAFSPSFLTLLAGTIPLMLILGGCLTIYLNYESGSSDYTEATDSQAVTDISKVPLPRMSTETTSDENTADKSIDDTPRFMGNIDSHVFHSSDCEFSKSKKCTAVFNTREEAIQEGYKPCGICKP